MTRCINTISVLTLAVVIPLFFSASLFAEDNSAPLDNSLVEKGKIVYDSNGCAACHTLGGGKLAGPDLLGVTKRREEQWLKKWLKSPDTMIFTDPIAKEMLKEYFVPMPNLGLNDEQIEQLIIYFKKIDEQVKD
ncbi:MAG: cytochrome c [Candidatus Dadabacteria bacterium]|nr:cytochrome c [Candidatus Dadabacteria bacterium]NIV41194.1 c-type cytochrome [Candidatus Dadabacteria bacterium]NIX14483.1 c-type cytochrome [Candidatus Dadabacteria bacterium]